MKIPYNKTFTGNIKFLYKCIKMRIARDKFYKNRKLLITEEDFTNFLLKNNSYKSIFENWVKNNFQPRLSPSVDRINNDGDYSIDNIQILTRYENRLKGTGEYNPKIVHLIKMRHEIIFKLKDEGYNGSQIGEIVNLNRATISRILQTRKK